MPLFKDRRSNVGWIHTEELRDDTQATVASLADFEWRASLIQSLVNQRDKWSVEEEAGAHAKMMAASLEAIKQILAVGHRGTVLCAYATAIYAGDGPPVQVRATDE